MDNALGWVLRVEDIAGRSNMGFNNLVERGGKHRRRRTKELKRFVRSGRRRGREDYEVQQGERGRNDHWQ